MTEPAEERWGQGRQSVPDREPVQHSPAQRWGPPPVMEGASFAPVALDPHTLGRVGIEHRERLQVDREGRRLDHVVAQHRYDERVRTARLRTIDRRIRAAESRVVEDRPLLRDAAIGFAAVATPLMLATSGDLVAPGHRRAAAALAFVVSAAAGHQWQLHQHSHRRGRHEAELERLREQREVLAIPQPIPLV